MARIDFTDEDEAALAALDHLSLPEDPLPQYAERDLTDDLASVRDGEFPTEPAGALPERPGATPPIEFRPPSTTPVDAPEIGPTPTPDLDLEEAPTPPVAPSPSVEASPSSDDDELALAALDSLTNPTSAAPPASASAMSPASPPPPPEVAAETMSKPPIDEERNRAAGPLPRLDAGLPSEDEISGARDADPFRRILHALGSGLMVAGHRQAPEFDDRVSRLEQERRAGLRSALASKSNLRQSEAATARTEARQRIEDERADRNYGLQVRQADTNEAASRALTASREAASARQASADELARSTREARNSATSSVSRGAQQAVRTTLAMMRPEMRARTEASFARPIESMTAEELAPIIARFDRLGFRDTGGGGTGGGSGTSATEARSLVIGDLVAGGMSQAEAERRASVMTPRELHAAVVARTSRMGEGGVGAGAGGGPTFAVAAPRGQEPLTLSTDVYSDAPSQRAVRGVLDGTRNVVSALNHLNTVYHQYPPSQFFVPGSPAATAMSQAQSRLATAQSGISNAGTINAGEREIYIQDSPPAVNWYDAITGGTDTYEAALDAWRDTLRQNVMDIAEGGGASPEQMEHFERYYLRGFPTGPGGSGGSAGSSSPIPQSGTRGSAPAAPAAPARVRIRNTETGATGSAPAGMTLQAPWEAIP